MSKPSDDGRKSNETEAVPEPDPAPTSAPSADGAPDGPGTGPTAGRDSRGRFAPGHRLTTIHGGYSARYPPGFEHLERDVADFVAGSLVDEGDFDDLTTRHKALLSYRARLHRRILQLDAALEARGILDRRQKLRTTWLSTLSALIERCRQIDLVLGLERRQKPVESPREWLQRVADERRAEQAEQTADEH